MASSQWDPLRDMEELLARYGRSTVQSQPGGRSEHIAAAEWRPLVDIAETVDSFLIEAEIPGVRREDVRVSVEDGVLTIQGRRDAHAGDASGRKQHRSERASGRFARSFALPEQADPERITARVDEGVLYIAVARRPERGGRGIEVKIG